MKILFLTQVLPFPRDAGPKIRAYYVLRHLSQSHDVTLLSFVRPSDTEEAVGHLSQFCRAVYTVPMVRSTTQDLAQLTLSLFTRRPFLIQRDQVSGMFELLRRVVDAASPPFDTVHADQLWMAPYALWAKRLGRGPTVPLTVLDQHNAVYMIPKRLADDEKNPMKRALLALECRKMANYEAEICRQFERVVWVTEDDYEAVQRITSDSNRPLPNDGVIPICTDPSTQAPIHRCRESRRLTFLGGLHYPPNAQGILWFAGEVFPQILEQAPDAVLTVIGKQPPDGLRALGIPENNLEVTGYVEDPTPYLAETAAFIVPLLSGGGMRVKIIDAWTWGIPIVSSSIGAEGIHVMPGKNILLADTPDEFAAATVNLLMNPAFGQQLVAAGRHCVEQRYSWRSIYRAWDRIHVRDNT